MILESGQYAIILRKIIHLSVRFLSHRKFLCLTRKISQNSKLEDYVNSPEVHRNARHILGSSIWYYTFISNLVSVASKVLLHHRNKHHWPQVLLFVFFVLNLSLNKLAQLLLWQQKVYITSWGFKESVYFFITTSFTATLKISYNWKVN